MPTQQPKGNYKASTNKVTEQTNTQQRYNNIIIIDLRAENSHGPITELTQIQNNINMRTKTDKQEKTNSINIV
jgi:hypothetical protein